MGKAIEIDVVVEGGEAIEREEEILGEAQNEQLHYESTAATAARGPRASAHPERGRGRRRGKLGTKTREWWWWWRSE